MIDEFGIDRSRPRTRWALARAGGWLGYYGEPIGWYTDIDSETGRASKRPIFRFKDTRDPEKACKAGLSRCYELGCPDAGACMELVCAQAAK